MNTDVNVYKDKSTEYGKEVVAVPAPEKNIGIDTHDVFYNNLVDTGTSSHLDISKLESFTQVSNNRETIMEVLDTMSEDPTVAAALEVYAEDATETNNDGQIMWCVSDDADVAKYVTYLLDTMNINKNIYKWTYSLCKYGDVYLRLYRDSEYNDDGLFDKSQNSQLNENLIVKAYSKQDKYSHYIDMVPNPAEMFELTRFGKTYAYVKANINAQVKDPNSNIMLASSFRYSFKKNDVELYDATNFVHASLEDNSSRVPEEIELFVDNYNTADEKSYTYSVKRGQSLLYNVYKIWRVMSLLENAMILNRLTKSSVIRIIGVQVGDMPKENVGPHLLGIKQLIEQKSAFDVGNSMTEYNNPGPVENNIYVPIHGEVGSIDIKTLDDDTNVTGLDDVDYFKNKLYSALRIPKSFLGDTDDAAGFNGGSSLALQSSRYAKAVKRIQNTMIQAVTDAVNLMLLDKGLDSYINKFELRMQAPTTQEEKDRRDNEGTYINMISDIMNLFDGVEIEDPSVKLKVLKTLLSNVVSDAEILQVLQDEVDKLDVEAELSDGFNNDELMPEDDMNTSSGMHRSFPSLQTTTDMPEFNDEEAGVVPEESQEDNILPTPAELGAGDFSDNNNPEL